MQRITIAYGDGIGTEIMDATLQIMKAAGAQLEYDVIEIGEKVYNRGIQSGIAPESWDTLRRNKVFLKSPITTPQGGGFKSLNVTVRKTLGLFANVRPCQAFSPYVKTHFLTNNSTEDTVWTNTWNSNNNAAINTSLKDLFRFLMNLPEFHLC